MMELTAGQLEIAVVTQAGERSCILPTRSQPRVQPLTIYCGGPIATRNPMKSVLSL